MISNDLNAFATLIGQAALCNVLCHSFQARELLPAHDIYPLGVGMSSAGHCLEDVET